jgi:hypothetical protein
MTLSPEAQRRAQENAMAAPPIPPAIRDQIRLILWGSLAPSSPQAGLSAEDADAA